MIICRIKIGKMNGNPSRGSQRTTEFERLRKKENTGLYSGTDGIKYLLWEDPTKI